MKLEPDLFGIAVQYFLHERMVCRAAWALVIAKLDQGQGRLFGAANMTAAFDICVGWRGSFFRLIGLTAQVDGGARRHGYSQDDHN